MNSRFASTGVFLPLLFWLLAPAAFLMLILKLDVGKTWLWSASLLPAVCLFFAFLSLTVLLVFLTHASDVRLRNRLLIPRWEVCWEQFRRRPPMMEHPRSPFALSSASSCDSGSESTDETDTRSFPGTPYSYPASPRLDGLPELHLPPASCHDDGGDAPGPRRAQSLRIAVPDASPPIGCRSAPARASRAPLASPPSACGPSAPSTTRFETCANADDVDEAFRTCGPGETFQTCEDAAEMFQTCVNAAGPSQAASPPSSARTPRAPRSARARTHARTRVATHTYTKAHEGRPRTALHTAASMGTGTGTGTGVTGTLGSLATTTTTTTTGSSTTGSSYTSVSSDSAPQTAKTPVPPSALECAAPQLKRRPRYGLIIGVIAPIFFCGAVVFLCLSLDKFFPYRLSYSCLPCLAAAALGLLLMTPAMSRALASTGTPFPRVSRSTRSAAYRPSSKTYSVNGDAAKAGPRSKALRKRAELQHEESPRAAYPLMFFLFGIIVLLTTAFVFIILAADGILKWNWWLIFMPAYVIGTLPLAAAVFVRERVWAYRIALAALALPWIATFVLATLRLEHEIQVPAVAIVGPLLIYVVLVAVLLLQNLAEVVTEFRASRKWDTEWPRSEITAKEARTFRR